MGCLQCLGDLQRHVERFVDGQRPLEQPVRQRVAVGQLHDDERLRVAQLQVVDGGDVGVVHGRQHARLAFEARQPLSILTKFLR